MEVPDMSFLDSISDWDHFIATDEMERDFLQILEQEIHPMLVATNETKNDVAVNESENEPPSSKTAVARFTPVLTDNELAEISVPFIPKNTKSNTDWAVKNFRDWAYHYNCSDNCHVRCREDLLENGSAEELNKFLSLYIAGTRQQNGEPYCAKTINSLLGGLLRYVREKNPLRDCLNFMDKNNKDFRGLNAVCDNVYRRLRSTGVGANPKKAELITDDDEETLWVKGVLGIHTPEALLNAVFFLNGKNFHLRGGDEHRFLRISQVQRHGNPDRYVYVENGSKNRSGGAKDFGNENKIVPIYANPEAKDRCHVFILDLYLSKLTPETRQKDIFYVRPAKKTRDEKCWFSNQAVGRNTLSKMTKAIFAEAQIEKQVTNHSLRVTGTTNLFQKGVPEKIIQERTGHKSISALRCYERTKESQSQAVSKILTGTSDKPFLEEVESLEAKESPKRGAKRSSPPQYLFRNCKVTIISASLENCSAFDSFMTENLDSVP